jgi:hypothetical protein
VTESVQNRFGENGPLGVKAHKSQQLYYDVLCFKLVTILFLNLEIISIEFEESGCLLINLQFNWKDTFGINVLFKFLEWILLDSLINSIFVLLVRISTKNSIFLVRFMNSSKKKLLASVSTTS